MNLLYKDNTSIICNICNKEFKNRRAIATHIKQIHGLTTHEYYDLFLKKDKEGICEVCGKPTRFKDFSAGYAQFCSTTCMYHSPRIIEQKSSHIKESLAKIDHNAWWYTLSDDDKQKIILKRKMSLTEESERLRKEHYKNTKIKQTILKYNSILNNCQIKYKEGNYYFCYCNMCNKNFRISLPVFRRRIKTGETMCMICNKKINNSSTCEKALYKFIKSIFPDALHNVKNIIPGYELDIFIPSIQCGIEYNGLFWHSNLKRADDYHYKKAEAFINHNIPLITVYEDQWLYSKETVMENFLNLKNNITFNDIIIECSDYQLFKVFNSNTYTLVEHKLPMFYDINKNTRTKSFAKIKPDTNYYICDSGIFVFKRK